MDRRRAAGALLALAACIASSYAAPTATSNHTALDLVDEVSNGCYYNFQHYGEGDRIMTNEPCLNCTCHNRMLMCYLRVCPFTKAIGQDCTVEKRADQCCPIVTCPDVPVDLLTSTSTSSPAEYGGTGIGKVDKYGCSINGKYFPEGAKVPPTPNKPCEHCYCIRNMTTCVMQECTLHVDGCTPIYHKDVCCPVRYFCDHPEDEMPLLDDMTTTVRPTPGFLLTTIAPTEEPETTTMPTRRDCIEDDQLYPDGALIKTEKPCEHCYCMKGDIVCVVQECGTPMENEGKNCTSLPPREGQCCPDTYICEGDEVSTEPSPASPFEEAIPTTVPSRRVSVEGSGYRNEDEMTYTEMPTFATELEGSGEEEITTKPVKETAEGDLIDKFGPADENEFIPKTTPISIPGESGMATTEPDKGLNTVPSEDEEIIKPTVPEQTTSRAEEPFTEPNQELEHGSTPITITEKGEDTFKPAEQEEETLTEDIPKATEPSRADEQTTPGGEITVASEEPSISEDRTTPVTDIVKESQESSTKETTLQDQKTTEPYIESEQESVRPEESTITETPKQKEEEKSTQPSVMSEQESIRPDAVEMTEPTIIETAAPTEVSKITEQTSEKEQEVTDEKEKESIEPSIETTTPSETLSFATDKTDEIPEVIETRRTSPSDGYSTTPKGVQEEQETESPPAKVTEPSISEQNTVPVIADEEQSSESTLLEKTTAREEPNATELPSVIENETEISKQQSSEPSIVELTTLESDIPTTKKPVFEETTLKPQEEETFASLTTGSVIGEEVTTAVPTEDILKETTSSEDKISEPQTTVQSILDQDVTATPALQQHEIEDTRRTTLSKESTTETIIDVSTFAHTTEGESVTTIASESGTASPVTQKEELPETTTLNLADNEIAEIPLPGRIPGEGDCLLEGITYKNDSNVPSSNKCHSGCKCISSIIKCDPIICSLPPDDMDNCQPRYDTPDACCPNYVCDHRMETIPPQPQSHITETESPTLSPAIECSGDQCQVIDDTQKVLPQTTDRVGTSECDGEVCEKPLQTPAEEKPAETPAAEKPLQTPTAVCYNGSCISPDLPAEEKPAEIPAEEKPAEPPAAEKPVETPAEEKPAETLSQEGPHVVVPTKEEPSCNDPENCKEAQTPTLCEGTSCPTGVQDQLCDKESGCVEPEIPPPKIVSELCGTDGECKPAIAPEPTAPICEGELCKSVTEECNSDECKKISPPLQPSQPDQICSEESGCKQPQEPMAPICEGESCKSVTEECSSNECKKIDVPLQPSQPDEVCSEESGCKKPQKPLECQDGKCTDKDLENKFGCSGNECMQQEPMPPTEDSADIGQMSTETSIIKETTPTQPLTTSDIENQTTRSPETQPTFVEENTTPVTLPDKDIKEPEIVTQSSQEETTSRVPDLTTEYSIDKSTETEIKPSEVSESEILQEQTTLSHLDSVTESHMILSTETTTPKELEILQTEDKTEQPALIELSSEETKPSTPISDVEFTVPQQSTVPEIFVTEQITKATEETRLEQEHTTTLPISTESGFETKTPDEKLEETSQEVTTPKYTEEEQLPEVSKETIEPVISVTEPESHKQETEKPEILETTQKPTTKTEELVTNIPTELAETSTPVKSLGEDEIKTEKPTEAAILEQEVQQELQTVPPERAGTESSTLMAEVTELSDETKLPESTKTEEKTPTTEDSIQLSATDEFKTEGPTTIQDEAPQPHITESSTPKTDVTTPLAESEPTISVEKTDKATTVSIGTVMYEAGKETESPLSLVTQQSEGTTTSIPISDDDKTRTAIPEVTTAKPEDHIPELESYKPPSVIELPPDVPSESETPLPSILEKVTTTEKALEEETEKINTPESEPTSSTGKQDVSSEATEIYITEPTKAFSTEEVTEIATKPSPVSEETEVPVLQDKTTEKPHEDLSHDITTELPHTTKEVIEEDIKRTTVTPETPATQVVEIITEQPQKELEQPELSSVPPTEQEIETELPQSLSPDMTIESSEKPQTQETTKEPLPEEISTAPEIEKEQPQPEIPVSVTASPISPLEESTEKVLTESTEREQEITEKPGDFITQPEPYETSSQQDRIDEERDSTKAPQKSTTEPTIEETATKQPETESTKDIDTKKDQSTMAPQILQEEPQTELQEVSTTEKSEYSTSERAPPETSSVYHEIEEEQKPTEETSSAVSELVETSTIEALKPTSISDEHTITEQKSTEVPAESPEGTEKPEEITSAVVPLPQEEDKMPELPAQTSKPEFEHSETTPFLVELEEHTHKMDEEEPVVSSSEEPATSHVETHVPEQEPTEKIPSVDKITEFPEIGTTKPSSDIEEISLASEEPHVTTIATEAPEQSTESALIDKFGSEAPAEDKEVISSTPKQSITEEEEVTTLSPVSQTEKVETEKPTLVEEQPIQPEKDATVKPFDVPVETTAPEEEFIPVTSKGTTSKPEEKATTHVPVAKPEERPSEMLPSTSHPETPKPDELLPTDEVPSPEDEAQFPPSGGYNQETEPDYVEEDQAFGPGTCRYGGKVYVSAQQIPRDDPCDFCFCFRSDIICLQQSCPPPIHGCHEEPIQGFCCPRYECPVSMATTLNVTTTTTTTTTTLPPHFLPHAYKGAAQRRGCQIKGHTYQVGEVVRASSGPCLHCTCGGDGQMKCDPKACTPEPMLRQMIAAAVSAKRRR